MDETMENHKKLTFVYTPISNKINPPLVVLISINKTMTVNNLKKLLLKSLDKEELGFNRVSLSRITKNRDYELLLESHNIKGTKAMNKFVYAFEVSYLTKSYTCLKCDYKYVDELKLHKDCNCFLILCDKCLEHYELTKLPFKCPVCYQKATMTSFIKIDKNASVISILNIPVSRCDDISNYLGKSVPKLGFPSYFALTFDNHAIEDSSPIDKNSIHFIDTQDHQCSQTCFFEKECYDDTRILLKTARKRLLSFFDSQNSSDKENIDSNQDKTLEKSNLQLNHQFDSSSVTSQNTFYKTDENLDDGNNNVINKTMQHLPPQFNSLHESQADFKDVKNIVLEKSSIELDSSQFEQKGIGKEYKQSDLLECLNEKFNIMLEFIQEKLHQIKEITTDCRINRMRDDSSLFKNLKFSGKDDSMHPVRFIEFFDFLANHEKLTDYEKQYFLGQSLVNEAAEWFNIRGYDETYENLRKSFLDFFWNKQDQNRFLSFLKRGKYRENTKLSKIMYFHKYATEAKFLDDAPDEEIVIDWLSEHFDTYIRTKLYGSRAKTIEEALQILRDPEIPDINRNSKEEMPLNFFSTSIAKKSRNGTWKDCFNNKYDIIKKESQIVYRCISTKLWPMHTLSYNNCMSEIRHFNVTCDEDATHFLSDVPEKLYWIFTDIKEMPRDYQVLGPVTVAKQNGRQLIVSTCQSFKTHRKLTAGQLLYFMDVDSFNPCGIISCSIREGLDYRYLIANNNEQIISLLCREKIEEIEFRESRTVAINDLIVRYFEQKFFKKRHILRFLNENYSTIYTVWDKATENYDPLKPLYH